jgi:CelD/BcsL family acetyltransferase involved in cellulose biosynthesis
VLHVEIIGDDARFAALREEWDELLARSETPSETPSVFLTWEWLHAWWRHLRGGRRLHLVAVRRDGELVALAPLAVRTALGGLFRRLELLGTGVVGSDYLDVVVRPDAADTVPAVLAGHLAGMRTTLDLRQLAAQASRAEAVAESLAGRGWRLTRRDTDVCPFLRLEGHTWDGFLATLGPEHRQNVRRRLRKLEQRGAVLQQVRTEDERRAALSALFRLHHLRWSGRGGSQAFDSPAVLAFHDEATRLLLERGWLRLYVLSLDGEPAAALYGVMYRGVFSFYQSGFDPRHALSGVGLATLALVIRRAIEEGAREFDLLHGSEPYKFLWTRDVRSLARLEADPPGWTARAARGLAEASLAARQGARRLARRVLPPAVAARLWGRRDLLRSPHVAPLG